ncbi:MAG: immunoglobulin-like domain-containing protein [Odoribacter splanchnicus]
MKFAIQIFLLLCLLLCGSCLNKQKKFQPEATNDHKVAIIGSADGSTEIVIGEDSCKQDRDTAIYEIPQCLLWYTKELSETNKGKEIRMWTERKEYWEDVQVINVFVSNPTDSILSFGRAWKLLVWNGADWVKPMSKQSLFWNEDAFSIERSKMLYCFRFPVGEYYHLPKGKYRLTKKFWANEKKLTLTADFNIYDTDTAPVKSLEKMEVAE